MADASTGSPGWDFPPGPVPPPLLHAALDGLAVPLAVLDTHGVVLLANLAWRQAVARGPSVLPLPPAGVRYPDACRACDTPEAAAFARDLDAMLAGRQARFQLEYSAAGPEPRWFLAQAARLPGPPVVVVVTHEDVTRRKRLENEARDAQRCWRELLESLGDGFYALDRHWRFTALNRAAESLLGRPREDLLGRNIWDEFPDKVGTTLEHEFRRAIADRVIVRFDRFYAHPRVWAEVRAFPTDDGLFVLLRDITERQRVTEAQQEAHVHAERIAQLEREVEFFKTFAAPQSAVTAAFFDAQPVPQRAPGTFAELVADYQQVLELALESRAYGTPCSPTEPLRTMSERLGFLRAGPRDVVEVHRAALDLKTRDVPPARAHAYVEEGRLLLVELMGHLVSFYRFRASPAGVKGPPPAPARPQTAPPKGDLP